MDSEHVSPFAEILGASISDPRIVADEAQGHVIGTPVEDAAHWEGRQEFTTDCAVKSEQFILEQFTGMHFDEGALCQDAAQHGWYDPAIGTPIADVGNLLAEHGVAVNRFEHASAWQLANELAQGHKVIVGVHAEDLWYGPNLFSSLANHAVVVSGIDTTDAQHPAVIVNDPASGEVKSYPMAQFLSAWQASDFFMVSTASPAPSHLPEMVNFDYNTGHIPVVIHLPYEQFVDYHDHPADYHPSLTVDVFDAHAVHIALTPEEGHYHLDLSVEGEHGHHDGLWHDGASELGALTHHVISEETGDEHHPHVDAGLPHG